MDTLTEALRVLNLLLIPVSIYIIRLERRLTRVETIINMRKKTREDPQCGKNY